MFNGSSKIMLNWRAVCEINEYSPNILIVSIILNPDQEKRYIVLDTMQYIKER